MGIKSLFTGLFGKSDNQMPSSLGNGHKVNQSYNLGNNSPLEEEDVTPVVQEKEKHNRKKKLKKGSKHNKKSKNANRPKSVESVTISETHNLIILDESGSMFCVRSQTISGCNETLNSIRNIAKEQPNMKQFVSIFCFDTTNSRYIFQDAPIENTRDLIEEDYCPNSCTPLYDAVGYTVTQLRRLIENTNSAAVVTIITDGYENASRKWNHQAVVELIDSLKKKGWAFTFIGANIDVEQTAQGLGINSYSRFEQTDEGMSEMFAQERRSRVAYSSKLNYMRDLLAFGSMALEEQEEQLGAMNHNYFVEKERVAPDVIQSLEQKEVFVFGSNIHGLHNGGAARFALIHFGAVNGQSEGLQGQSYAIPTDGNTFDELKEAVGRFTDYVVMHPQNKFMLTAVGCGAAGYSVDQIAPLFTQAYSFGNVYVPQSFLPYVSLQKERS
jgi:hypothetical protein